MLRKWFFAALLIATPALAHAAGNTWGPRLGFSIDPDQFVFGGQYSFDEIAKDVSFDPNLDIGFGDNATVVTFNADLHYHFEVNTEWAPYAGAGVGISFVSIDAPAGADDSSDTQVGGSLIVGAEAPPKGNGRFFAEFKLGLGDIPDLKLIAGWNFKI